MKCGRTALLAGVLAVGAAVAGPAVADVTVGIIFSLTGAGSSFSIPHRNVWNMVPKRLGNEPAKYLILDDATNPAEAVKLMRRLITEDKVDVIVGTTNTPGCVAMSQVALETRIPHVCMAPIVVPPPKAQWVYTMPPRVPVIMDGVVQHMKANGAKTVGFIGFADALGEVHLQVLEQLLAANGMRLVAKERFNRADTSVTSQALKVQAANPDAVFVGASGTPAAMPHLALVERGYKGRIYHTNAVLVPDFLRVGGKSVEGAIAPTAPMVMATQLPDSNPIKKVALDFLRQWDSAYGAETRSPFAGYSYDGYLVLDAAVGSALRRAKPGTPEFRVSLREAIENVRNVVGTSAVYNLSPTDHNGVDSRALAMVRIENGEWKLLK
jgi:branched-chain amino acid transport system substrate-binding protein